MSTRRGERYDTHKRAFDFVVALGLFILTLPLQAAVGLAVSVGLGRPILFRQARPGLNGEVFELVKFRTMRPPTESEGVESDKSRLTGLGRFLRSTSLDELPTLMNVVKGEMSLVGPRPLLVSYLDRYSPEQARRHEVRPGVTGLAQVSGRNELSWEDKLRLDVEYVDQRSMAIDLRILRMTVSRVVRRSGISAPGHATAAEFEGSHSLPAHE